MMVYVNAHTHQPPHEGILSVVNIHKVSALHPSGTLCSAGLHPWHLRAAHRTEDLAWLEESLIGPDVVAVGECGLDRQARTPWELQVELFEEQLTLAARFQKPVIIHNVRSGSDLLQIRKETCGITPWLIHGFHGSVREAELFVQQECYLGFGRMVLNPASKAVGACEATPIERILPETDDHPVPIEEVYKGIARIKKVSSEVVASTLYANFVRFYNLYHDAS